MLVVFSSIFVADTNIFQCDFVAPLTTNTPFANTNFVTNTKFLEQLQ